MECARSLLATARQYDIFDLYISQQENLGEGCKRLTFATRVRSMAMTAA